MKKKLNLLLITMMAGMLLLSGCRPSDEKLSEVETARNIMLEAKENARETYLDITDSSMQNTLDELDKKASEIEEMEFTKYSNKKIDEILPQITELTENYQSLQSGFETTLKTETEEKAEAEKATGVEAYLINKTGMNLTEVVLHDVTTDTYTDNLLGEGVILESGYTLMGVVLEINKDSSEWEFVVKNENNTSYTLSSDSFNDVDENGVSVTLKYNSDSQSGSAMIGNYSALESIDETTEDSSSEVSSQE